ncbi:MAG: hypothetical protein K6U08_09870, partial [Firmicutes bacterium]|nr:hypothetical protein [Bacillota bacterium]
LREGEWSTSDLPDIVCEETGEVAVPAGAGTITLDTGQSSAAVSLELVYGGFHVRHTYRLDGPSVRVSSTLRCLRGGRYRLFGVPALALRVDPGHHVTCRPAPVYREPNGEMELELCDDLLLPAVAPKELRWETTEPSSTSRGRHVKVGRTLAGCFAAGETLVYSFRIRVGGETREQV